MGTLPMLSLIKSLGGHDEVLELPALFQPGPGRQLDLALISCHWRDGLHAARIGVGWFYGN
jgi:hypothetical protein